jgi:hypothetical protein
VAGYNVTQLRLPDIDIQGLMDQWSEWGFGSDWETRDRYGRPTTRHEPGMFDIARNIAAEEQHRKRRAFDLYERAKETDIAAAQQAMELQRIADQRARQAELQARKDQQRAELLARADKERQRQALFHHVEAPGGQFMRPATMPGHMQFDPKTRSQMWTDYYT